MCVAVGHLFRQPVQAEAFRTLHFRPLRLHCDACADGNVFASVYSCFEWVWACRVCVFCFCVCDRVVAVPVCVRDCLGVCMYV